MLPTAPLNACPSAERAPRGNAPLPPRARATVRRCSTRRRIADGVRLVLVAALLLPSTACFQGLGGEALAEASDYMRCPQDHLEVKKIAEDQSCGWPRHRFWNPATYRVIGCGKTIVVDCPEWDSYDQRPICYPHG